MRKRPGKCEHCHSTQISINAEVEQDQKTGEINIKSVHEGGHICKHCDRLTKLLK